MGARWLVFKVYRAPLPTRVHFGDCLWEVCCGAFAGGEAAVRTDGGRCDVHVKERLRVPVYWEGPPSEVRRCTWFYKPETHSGFVPYEEDVAALLEVGPSGLCQSCFL